MKPNFSIIADNKDVTDLLQSRLLSLSISDEIGLVSDTLTIKLDNRDSVFEIPSCGANLQISLGYDSDIYSMGHFVVDEIELNAPPETLTITARASNSMLHDLGSFRSPKSKSWENQNLSSIVSALANAYGMQAELSSAYKGIFIDHIDQTCESDCAFIQRLATEYGGSVKISGGKLLFIDPYTGQFPDGTPLPKIQVGELSDYSLRITERNKYGRVVAKYYDFDAGEEKEVTIGNQSPTYTFRETFNSEIQAKSRANAKLANMRTGIYTLNIDMPGNPLLSAESVLDIQTGAEEILGTWIVKAAMHVLNSSGYKTSIEATKPRE